MKNSKFKLRMLSLIVFLTLLNTAFYCQSVPYVILISFDGFRWDYANRDITPNIDYIKENGISTLSFQPAFPSKTFPNHYSIITGMYPEHHGIIFNSIVDKNTHTKFTLRDSVQVNNSYWYRGEAFWETARRQGIITASYFWPGSTIELKYRRPDYFMYYEHSRPYEMRIDGIVNWLNLPPESRPHFLTLYFEATDDAGHKFGPEAPETNFAIAKLDSTLGLLFERLKSINMLDSVNIILVSDHGMTPVSGERIINVEELISSYKCEYSNSGPVMMIQPEKDEVEEVYSLLKKNEHHFKVYNKQDIPEYYNFTDSFLIYDLIVVADLGWSVLKTKQINRNNKETIKGNHGYDNHQTDMQGIFFAMGPKFKKHYSTGTLNCVDVYPLLCKIFNIFPNSNIDGKLDRIEFILNEN